MAMCRVIIQCAIHIVYIVVLSSIYSLSLDIFRTLIVAAYLMSNIRDVVQFKLNQAENKEETEERG